MKKLTEKDIVNHLRTVQSILMLDLKQQQTDTLTTVLLEYLVSSDYVFRGAALWNGLDLVRTRWSESQLVNVLRQVFTRISKESIEPVAEIEIKQSESLDKKIRSFLNIVVPKNIQLEQDTFLAVVQLIAHPKVSSTTVLLKQNSSYLAKTCKVPCDVLFAKHSSAITDQFLRERTGIINPN